VSASQVHLGVVGAGAVAQRVLQHLMLSDAARKVRVTAIYDPITARAEATARRFGPMSWYGSLDDLFEADEVDAVTIASPTTAHYEQGLAAVQRGKHVHFNKTMTLTCAQATAIIQEAARRDVRLVASPGEVLRPHVQRTRQLVAEGAIGRVCWVTCGGTLGDYHINEAERRGLDGIDPSWPFTTPGGGPLYDLTVYGLHNLTAVLGSVQRVTAMSGICIPLPPPRRGSFHWIQAGPRVPGGER
jgi:predicted dehydrogenase